MPVRSSAFSPGSHPTVRAGAPVLLVGTTKGAFLLHAGPTRTRWKVHGPYFPGHAVYAMAYDGRGDHRRIWAAIQSMHWGAVLCSSDDFGEHWAIPEAPSVAFPPTANRSLKQIWQIAPEPRDEPDTIYCGVEPAALFMSRNAGISWEPVTGLLDHPHAPLWQPGGGGLCLHTIITDPADAHRMLVAISTGGVYRTDDGGRTWQSRNAGIRAEFLPDKYPEFGQCVHKVVHHPARPGRLFLQNHWGLYRSDDWGDTWHDIANGVPSDFGFPMAMHPRDADTVYIIPLQSDEFRCVPEGKLRVYRTQNAGKSWTPLTRGLPQRNAYETVLRDAMTVDPCTPAGVYFGTRSGKLYGSRTEGASWQLVADGLPPIACVKALVPIPVSRGASHGKSRVQSHAASRKTATHRARTSITR